MPVSVVGGTLLTMQRGGYSLGPTLPSFSVLTFFHKPSHLLSWTSNCGREFACSNSSFVRLGSSFLCFSGDVLRLVDAACFSLDAESDFARAAALPAAVFGAVDFFACGLNACAIDDVFLRALAAVEPFFGGILICSGWQRGCVLSVLLLEFCCLNLHPLPPPWLSHDQQGGSSDASNSSHRHMR